jgi:hypothetical protein
MQQLQFDFLVDAPSLAPPTPSAPSPLPASPIVGLTVRIPVRCRCGSVLATIGSSHGPHAHRCDCTHCGRWCMWLSHAESKLIAAIVSKFGAPTTPIVLRPHGHHAWQDASS